MTPAAAPARVGRDRTAGLGITCGDNGPVAHPTLTSLTHRDPAQAEEIVALKGKHGPRNLQINSEWALSFDRLQWILQRRKGTDKRTGSAVFSGEVFVSSTRDVLARVMREKGIPIEDARSVLDALPESFAEYGFGRRSRPARPRWCPESRTAPPTAAKAPTAAIREGLVAPEPDWPGLYRVRGTDGRFHGPLNLTRATEVAERLTSEPLAPGSLNLTRAPRRHGHVLHVGSRP